MAGVPLALLLAPAHAATAIFDVRSFGAKGDGRALDTQAINRAIEAAAQAGGGTVLFPAGRYLSFSIRLKSNIALIFAPGAVIEAADPAVHAGSYDLPENKAEELFQDFGHSHWHNSLIWGDGVENVTIAGPGLIDGKGLTRSGPGARWRGAVGGRPLSMGPETGKPQDAMGRDDSRMHGLGNKAIALKNARRITLRDFSILKGGHFGILATGVDDLTIDNLRIDTNRDGIDLDAVRNCRVTNCIVNTPNDDAIVLKSSYGLGMARPCENVTISGCHVSGYDMGSMLDGTYRRTQQFAPDKDGVTGRIKLGTEATGGFRNIAITNCIFERSRGLALETVDGAALEDVVVANITMREVTTAPLFLRVGDRRRAPAGAGLASMRRVSITNLNAFDIDPRYAASIVGLPDSPIEDVTLTDIRLVYRGGGGAADAERSVPEPREAYPEPSMFGVLPAYGLFVRHCHSLQVRGLRLEVMAPDARPPIILDTVADARFDDVATQRAGGVPPIVARETRDLLVSDTPGWR